MSATSTARDRVSRFGLGVAALSVVGFLLAWAFDWPSTFVLGDAPDAEVGPADVVNGTVTSIPLVPLVVLVVASLAARSRRGWGTAAVVVLMLLGVVFTVGGIGELVSDNDAVSRAVVVVAGLLFTGLGIALAALAAAALRARPVGEEQPPGRHRS